MLAKCDTCHLYYHLNCLNPPLTRLPKKSKLYGWQCSECDKTSDSDVEEVKTPRRSRNRYSKEGKSDQEVFTPKVKIKPVERSPIQAGVTIHMRNYASPNRSQLNSSHEYHDKSFDTSSDINKSYSNCVMETSVDGQPMVITSRSGKKRRRDKHRSRYSPEFSGSTKEHKRKRKKKSLDMENPNPHPRITIKVNLA